MLKNRIFLTFTALALGVSLVGVANAGTISSVMKSEEQRPALHQTDMTEHKVESMNKAMEIEITEKGNVQTVESDQSTVMGPQMNNSMQEIHKNMPVQEMHNNMNEIHKNIPHQQHMGKNHVNMHGGSGMGAGMMGR